MGGLNTDQGYQLVIEHPETQQPYHSSHVESGDMTPAGLMSRLDNMVKGIPRRAERSTGNLDRALDSVKLYEQQIATQFGGDDELAHNEKLLRVIQARMSENEEADDPDIDVMADYEAPDTATREAPDVDAMDIRVAVEAVRSREEADTPEEVADALEDALEDVPRDTSEPRPAPDIPATPEPDERDDPPDIPAIPPAAEVEEPEQPAVSEPEPAEPDTSAVPAPGVAAATPQPETEPDKVKVPVDELDAIAAEFNFGSFLSLPDNLKSVVTELYRARSGLSKETAITPEEPEPEKPEADEPLPDMTLRRLERLASESRESGQLTEDEAAVVISRTRAEREERERAEAEARPDQTAAEMIEAAREGPVPLTGPGSIMEKLAEEAEAKQSTEQPKRRSPRFEVHAAADLVMGKLKEDTAFQNALRNTDGQNIRAEYKNALSRVSLELLDEGHVDFYRWLVDNPRARGRLDFVLETRKAFQPTEPEAVDADVALRREIRDLGGSVPSGVTREQLQALRDDLKAGGTAGRRISVVTVGPKQKKADKYIKQEKSLYLSNPHLTPEERQEAEALFGEWHSKLLNGALTESGVDKRLTEMRRKHERQRSDRQRASREAEDSAAIGRKEADVLDADAHPRCQRCRLPR